MRKSLIDALEKKLDSSFLFISNIKKAKYKHIKPNDKAIILKIVLTTITNLKKNMHITTLPISGAPEQECQITAITFYLLKIFLKTYNFKEQLVSITNHKN